MSDMMKAIDDDIDDYKRLCDKYGEKVRYGSVRWGRGHTQLPDCYGKHAESLKERERKENAKMSGENEPQKSCKCSCKSKTKKKRRKGRVPST